MNRKDFFKQLPLFAGLSSAEVELLAGDFVRREFRQEEVIFHQGDPGRVLYVIESGQVQILVHGEAGQETSVILYGPGDMFGELAVIDGLPRSATAVAIEDAVVYTLSRDRLREHMRRHPQLAVNFLQALSTRVRYNTQQVDSLTMLNVPQRLARKLLELAQRSGRVMPEGVRIDVGLSQSQLASLVGTSRESINKALGTFRKQGLVAVQQRRIVILDPDGLRDLST